jgi:predicted AAA+ superfamily ATPase
MSVKVLWPLSQGEIEGQHEDFTSLVFSNKAITYNTKSSWTELVERICTGGFPEVTLLDDWELKEEWFSSYIKTMLDRDVREIANVDGLRLFPRLLSLLALRASTVVNYADIGRLTEIAKSSLMRYVSLLESIFLVHSVPAWYKNPEKRLVKSSKLLFSDTGLLCRIRNTGRQLLIEDRSVAGLILENFVGMELVKQLSWSKTSANLYHYRSRDGAEVDFVLEDDRNRVVGIEIKTSVSVNSQDLSGLNHLRKTVGKKFHRGLILYTGDKSITLGKDIMAVPISALWNSTV